MRHLIRRVVLASLICLLSAHVVTPEVSPTVHATVAEVKKIEEIRCTATAIYREAGNQSREGQIAVAQVVLNRANDYHLTSCEVIYQKVNGVKQFNWNEQHVFDAVQFNKALKLATDLYNHHEKYPDKTGHATFFHAVYVDPGEVWTDRLVRTVRIQDHIFYRLPKRLVNHS